MKIRILTGCPILLLLTVLTVHAQGDQAGLRGVPSMDVTIEALTSEALAGGLSMEQLRADVELRLRKSGVRVSKDAVSFLYVQITTLKTVPCNGLQSV
jgi:hypothetical protein